MIRKLKVGEKYKYKEMEYYLYQVLFKEEEIFANENYFLHNDVGPAIQNKKDKNAWYWNGIFII